MNKKNKIIFIGIVLIWFMIVLTGCASQTKKENGGAPSDIELMSYAQTILDDNLISPKYSSNTKDYTFTQTGLRYKIEGRVTTEGLSQKFYIVINFTDSKYTEYDLISLQVGNKKIY